MNPTPDTSTRRNLLSSLYDQYSSPLFGFIVRIAGNKELAEAILQQTFLEIFTRIAEMDYKKDNKLSWMLNIALVHSLKCMPETECPPENKLSIDGDGEVEGTNPEAISKLIRKVMIDIHFKGQTLEEAAANAGISLSALIGAMKKAFNLLPGEQIK